MIRRVLLPRQVPAPKSKREQLAPAESQNQLPSVYRQLAENIPHVFWMADCRQKRLIYVSPAMLDLWLLEPRVILNDPSQWFAYIHPADRSRAEETLNRMLSGTLDACEYRIIRPDGEIRSVRNRSFPVPDTSGAISRVAGIVEDVTTEQEAQRAFRQSRDELVKHVNELKSENRERRRAEEELRSAKDLAEAGNRAKTQFVRNISHELRTPLNGIMGMLQIALDASPPADQEEYLRSASSSAAHLLAIVDDILDFSESETGRLEITPGPCDVRECVRDVVKRIAPQAFAKKLDLAFLVSVAVPPTVTADAKRIAQILGHLLTNAVKFSTDGYVCLEVAVARTSLGKPCLQFTVTDTGIGISPDHRETIFEAFTQADGSLTRSYGGLGLGLSICARLVALMGGEIIVESEPNRGSRFGFLLPIDAAEPANVRPREVLDGKKILVVEAGAAHVDMAVRSFSEVGMKVTVCHDGTSALAELDTPGADFDAILLGGKLPNDMDLVGLSDLMSNRYGLGRKLIVAPDPTAEQLELSRARKIGLALFNRPIDYDAVLEAIRKIVTAAEVEHPSSLPAVPAPPRSVSLRILLVEDNLINQTVLKRMLQKLGHLVTTADNGLIGLRALEEMNWAIDLVLMDMQMPELDGYETTKRIRAIERERGGHLPIVAATAHAMAGDAERCLNAGMDGYVTKPIQMDVLAAAIAKVVDHSPALALLDRKVS